MEEQLNNPDSPQPQKEKSTAIVIGVLIFIIIVLVAGGFYFLKMKNAGVQPSAPAAEKITPPETTPAAGTQSGQAANLSDQTASNSSASSTSASSSQSAVDFNYELKQLDNQANSAGTTDFNDAEMSDTKAGL